MTCTNLGIAGNVCCAANGVVLPMAQATKCCSAYGKSNGDGTVTCAAKPI
jgi:hypothetical protein